MSKESTNQRDQLRGTLDAYSVPAAPALYTREEGQTVRCMACAHQCKIAPDHRGICCMRHNRGGVLYAPSGYVAGLQADPIEKKPFYHVLPGANALSFGMLGCNLQCDFCQNWISSQTLRDADAIAGIRPATAGAIVDAALKQGAPVVVSTYNEPLITADWAAEIFREARGRGLLCGFVSNGYATREVLSFLRPVTDLFKVDLKCFTEEGYRRLGGRLRPVLETIEQLLALGYWVEVVTLVVPGFNDSEGELEKIAAFLASLSADIPWHVTAFYPTYKHLEAPPTSQDQLERAWRAGTSAGLRYVYTGNMAGRLGGTEHTSCHACGEILIARRGFQIIRNDLNHGCCPHCNATIPGRWSA